MQFHMMGSGFCELREDLEGEILNFGYKKRQMSRKILVLKLGELIDTCPLLQDSSPCGRG
jgi:hypothetical protein